jgi:single-strand DNA-binding protein
MLKISGLGRLTKDPEMKYTPAGTAVTNFTLAVNTGYGDKKVTAWVRISSFGKQAEVCNQYLTKGSQIAFSADVSPDKETGNPRIYTGNDGVGRSIFEAKLSDFEFASTKAQAAPAEEDVPEWLE